MGIRKYKSHLIGFAAAGILLTLIVSVLIPPAISVDLTMEKPTPSSGGKNQIFTFSNINITISGVETIPITSINFTVFLKNTDEEVDNVRFNAYGIEYQDQADAFVTRLVSPSQSILEDLFIPGVGYGYGYGYGYGDVYEDITLTYQVNYSSHVSRSTEYYARFFVDTSEHIYSSAPVDFKVIIDSGATGGNDPPIACFTWEDADGSGSGTLINFDASCSTDDYGIDLYEWDWNNDGTFDAAVSVTTASHDFDDINLHTVKLRVTDTNLATDIDSLTVSATIGTGNNPPIADIDGPYVGNLTDLIEMDASGSSDSDGTIVGYRWDWENDGTYDTDYLTLPTTSHSYLAVGSYIVKLEVKDNGGLTDTETTHAWIYYHVKYIAGLNGYLLDTDNDSEHTYDQYLNLTSMKIIPTGFDNSDGNDKKVLIDDDNDGQFEYSYKLKQGTYSPRGAPGQQFPIWLAIVGVIVAIVIIIIVLFKKGYIYLE